MTPPSLPCPIGAIRWGRRADTRLSGEEASYNSSEQPPEGLLHLPQTTPSDGAGEASLLMQSCARVAKKPVLNVRGSSSALTEEEGPAPMHPVPPSSHTRASRHTWASRHTGTWAMRQPHCLPFLSDPCPDWGWVPQALATTPTPFPHPSAGLPLRHRPPLLGGGPPPSSGHQSPALTSCVTLVRTYTSEPFLRL